MGPKEEVSKKIKLFESISRQLSNQKMTLTEEARKIEEHIRAREQGKDQEVVGEGEGSSSDSRVANEVVANQRSIENSVTEHASSTSDSRLVDSVDYASDTTGANTPASDQFGPETSAHSALDD